MGEPMTLQTSDAVFAEATPEQRQLAWELNGEVWAAPLSTADYQAREKHLSEQELTRNGGCRYWVLYLKGHPRQIIASCETIRKAVLITENGVSREGHGYGIASVYTNPEYRRQGMAAFMLLQLQKAMDANSDCSVLYSDIGRTYYAALGWTVFPSNQVTLNILSSILPATFALSQGSPQRTRYLRLDELPDLCEVDELHLSVRFDSFAADGKTHIAFVPSFAQIAWQLAREDFMGEKGMGKTPDNKGAMTDNGRSWVYWNHDWRSKKLKVMRIVQVLEATKEQRVEDVRELLETALAEASFWDLSSVVVWSPDDNVSSGAKAVADAHPSEIEVVFDERADSSIPSLRWSGGKDSANTVWEDNFSYCWC